MEIKEYVKLRKEFIKNEVSNLKIKPKILIIQVNQDEASKAYVKGKIKDCVELGIEYLHLVLNESISQDELIKLINQYNNDNSVHGIIVQMPLPKQIDEEIIKKTIAIKKDIDGFNPLSDFKPCTPKGILDYLKFLNFEFIGKNAVVIGRSNIVGKPMANLLINESCNVTVLHSKTSHDDMEKYLSSADLIVSAVGKKYILEGYKFKPSAYLIDVGITRFEGKLYGDFPPNLRVSLQTPVPGGVGLLTRLTLLENLMEAYKNGI